MIDAGRAFFLPFVALLVSCAGAGATFNDDVFRGADGIRFRVGNPASEWQRVSVDNGALGFRDSHGASVLVEGRCGLHGDDVPLGALFNQLIMGTTERSYVKEETIPFDHREALHTVMNAKLDGVPLVWNVYVMKKNGCVYDIVYVAPPARYRDEEKIFEQFALGFQSLERAT